MNHYISNHEYVKDSHFDSPQYKVDDEYKEYLKKQGDLDDRLAFHIASLFVRDPIPTYGDEHDESKINDEAITSHFENLQSTNWNSMRFKPPPSKDSKIGWRVEFRTLDIQITDFENAALTILLGMITNVINNFDVDFIMPISMIDENMDRAHKRDAILNEKFWFKTSNIKSDNYKTNILKETDYLRSSCNKDCDSSDSHGSCSTSFEENDKEEYHELYVYEIFEGKSDINFKGILPLIDEYMT